MSAAAPVISDLHQDYSSVNHQIFASIPGEVDHSEDFRLDEERIRSFGDKYQTSGARSFSSELLRADSLSEIHSGLNTLGNIIKIVTAVMSLFGSDSLDRNDSFESSLTTLLQLGTSVFNIAMTALGSAPQSSLFASKVGVADGVDPGLDSLSPEQMLHRQQVQALIASLSPEQVKVKQSEVIQHVSQQATDQGLTSEEATKLLQETLEYNGLPAIGDTLPSSSSSSGSSSAAVPGLPVPGTLEHSMALTLFNAQQYVNSMFTKTGDTDSSDSSGIMSAVSSLPQSLSSAAVSVLKFVSPSQQKTDPASAAAISTGLPGQTYSEVVTGVDPAYAALGVLTTGALGSVAYSYLASDSDIASSATNLALGAVDAIARNDVVQNIANNDIMQKITDNEIMNKIANNHLLKKATDAISQSKFLQTASNALEKIRRRIKGEKVDPDQFDHQKYYNVDYAYGDTSDYSSQYDDGFSSNWDTFQTNFDYYQELDYTDRYPYTETEVIDRSKEAVEPGDVEWYEPEPSSVPAKVPYISYTEDTNPWLLMNTGQSTEHLYRSFN